MIPKTLPITDHPSALAFLLSRIDFERQITVPYRERNFKLDRMRELLARLGDPQRGMPIVHIAGTKGKGSTATMIAAMLAAAGYRTGLYMSPHLDRLEERMAIDGRPCEPQQLVQLAAQVQPVVEALDREAEADPAGEGPTYFEITTAMALLHFAQCPVDVAVLEVGMGGRLDSTNVCQPTVSVITSISFDHMRQLGNTLAAIAREKAGIIKPGAPVVSGVVEPEPRGVIEEVARAHRCRLIQRGVDFDFRYAPPRFQDDPHAAGEPLRGTLDFYSRGATNPALAGVTLGMVGRHQAANASVALATAEVLREAGWSLPEPVLRAALADLSCPARVEVVSYRPRVVIDAAHNAASIEALVQTLEETFFAPGCPPTAPRILVFATTIEKDIRNMLAALLPRFDIVLLTKYRNNPRGVDPAELLNIAGQVRAQGNGREQQIVALPDPQAVCRRLTEWVQGESLVCVTGSFFIAAEMRALLRANPLPAGAPLAGPVG